MTTKEALSGCNQIAKSAAEANSYFNGEWKLQIFSPYSGDQYLASCTLN